MSSGAASSSADPAAPPPCLERAASFDLSSLRQLGRLVAAGKYEEASLLLADDVSWRSLDGNVASGREACARLFEAQSHTSSFTRAPLGDWVIVPKDVDEEEDIGDSTFQATRLVQYTNTGNQTSFRVVQTVSVVSGLITRMNNVREKQFWDPGLDDLEVLRRFAVARIAGDDQECAASYLQEEGCYWQPFLCAAAADGRTETGKTLVGRAAVLQLWAQQRAEGMLREPMGDWQDQGDGTFRRLLRISAPAYEQYFTVKQIGQVVGGQIAYMTHALQVAV
eukprot:TRINITY_DN29398_c0_g1_i1.p1 TRINITY_DN29398_c0_g1~~TRINITY_DN29398_c0_g1_i1.p1  ORF type:complete len:296 (-),score=60.68 TRINITY_DN29398_c0_g1_i1:6-845(-)